MFFPRTPPPPVAGKNTYNEAQPRPRIFLPPACGTRHKKHTAVPVQRGKCLGSAWPCAKKKIQTRDPRFCSKHATIWLLWQYEKIHSIWTVVPWHIRETFLRTCRPASDPCSVYSFNPRKSERSSFSNVFPGSSLCRPFLTTFGP